jgi:hypothetical protein
MSRPALVGLPPRQPSYSRFELILPDNPVCAVSSTFSMIQVNLRLMKPLAD